MSSPDPPEVRDPGKVAETQQQYNRQAGIESQAGSMVNQYNPYGSLEYSQTGTGPGGVPIYSANIKLSPAQQQLLNTLQGNQQTAGNYATNLLGGANYGGQTPSDVIGGTTSGLTKDLIGKYVDYLNPFFTQQTDQLDTKLKNQGLQPGTPAYDQAMNAARQSQNQTVTKYTADIQPQAYQQAKDMYLTPLAMASQLMGLSQPGSVNQNLVNAPALNEQPANYIGAVANAQDAEMKAYQAKLQQQQGMMSGLFGTAGNVLGGWAKGGFGNPFGSMGGTMLADGSIAAAGAAPADILAMLAI